MRYVSNYSERPIVSLGAVDFVYVNFPPKNSRFIEAFDSGGMQLSFIAVGECEGVAGFAGSESAN